jgi:hypothetical protein
MLQPREKQKPTSTPRQPSQFENGLAEIARSCHCLSRLDPSGDMPNRLDQSMAEFLKDGGEIHLTVSRTCSGTIYRFQGPGVEYTKA